MLLDGFGVQKGGITEFQLRDLKRGAFDSEFLHVAFANRIRDDRVLERTLESVRRKQLLHSVTGLIYRGAGFGECPVEEGKLAANGIAQRRIREPWNVIEVDGDSRRFLRMISYHDAGELGLEVVTYFGKEAALNELVGGGLQIIPGDLRARNQTRYSDDLCFGEDFLAVDVDFAQG